MEQIKANETLVDSSLRETKMHGTVDFPVGVYLDDFSDFKNGYICWHWHEEIQISWIIEGEFLCQMEGRTVHLHPGELIFVNRGVLHQIYPVQKGYGKLYAFIWDPEFLSGSADGAVYQEAFEAMLKSGPRCLTLAETAQAPGGQAVGEELARQALTSRSELCRCFRRMLGMPPKEFLMQYRIQQAEILLKNSAYSIAEVAEFTGFSSPSHFGSCFLRYVGCTPREYRKSL